ncbi:DUF3379 domain-containing protein [Pseudoalteromonas sp. SSM20]|uniref:DUF3379 domain-containing protein n=1 Tax=Pseudoalteromonas sp. SSM20 TaxID=3139394 RepID=UPI003BAA6ED0
MDELELRRRLYADPNTSDKDVLNALESDPDAHAFSKELKALDNDIEHALNVPVPENLAERLVLNQSLHAFQTQRKKTRIHLALAASVAFLFGVSFTYLNMGAPLNLEQHALAHVYHEPSSLTNVNHSFSLQEVNAKLASFGGNFSELPNQVSYLTFCDFKGQKSLHLVFQTEQGPMTLFIVPSKNQYRTESYFSDEAFDGATYQGHKANLILLGEKGQALSPYNEKLQNSLQWRI